LELAKKETCDKCNRPAKYRVKQGYKQKTLLFCGHHAFKYQKEQIKRVLDGKSARFIEFE